MGAKSLTYLANGKVVIKGCGIARDILGLACIIRHQKEDDAFRREILAFNDGRGDFYAVFVIKNGEILNTLAGKKVF